jgi:hypothetical protein
MRTLVRGAARACFRGAAIAALAALVAAPRASDPYPVAKFLRAAVVDSAATSPGGPGWAGIPYLRVAEIRVRNESFDLGRQRYTLQLSPKGLGEEGAARRLEAALTGRGVASREASRDASLRERHLLVVEITAARVLGDLYKELADVEEERIRVLERRNVTDAFDFGDILRAEGVAGRHRERCDEARAREALARDRARVLTGYAELAAFDTAGIIGVEGVEAWALTTTSPDTASPSLRAARRDAEAADAQYRLAVAENRRFLSFIEFGYDYGTRRQEAADRADGKDYDLDKAYLVEVGFRLPWGGSGGTNVLRRRVEAEGRRAALRRETEEEAADLRSAVTAIRTLAARYRAVRMREAALDGPARLRRYVSLSSADPVVVLTLRQALLESTLRREEARFDMLREYIEAAAIAGEFSRRPARNMLSERMEPLGE